VVEGAMASTAAERPPRLPNLTDCRGPARQRTAAGTSGERGCAYGSCRRLLSSRQADGQQDAGCRQHTVPVHVPLASRRSGSRSLAVPPATQRS
jgi:hypothetical protein